MVSIEFFFLRSCVFLPHLVAGLVPSPAWLLVCGSDSRPSGLCPSDSWVWIQIITGTQFCKFLGVVVQLLSRGSDSLQPHELQHARPPCPSPSPGACSNSCPLSQWCHLTICHPPLLPSVFPSISKFTVGMAKFDTWTTTGSKEIPCHLRPFGPNISGEFFVFSWTWPSHFILQKISLWNCPGIVRIHYQLCFFKLLSIQSCQVPTLHRSCLQMGQLPLKFPGSGSASS